MKFIVWTREDINQLTPLQKAKWFDVYNNNLFIDSELDITTMSNDEIHKAYKKIQNGYYQYLDSLLLDSSFVFYLILSDDDIYLSLIRVILRDKYFTIEGYETHRDHQGLGHGTFIISECIKVCKEAGIPEVYANIYTKNKASLKSFLSNGFKEVKTDVDNRIRVCKRLG